jgi:DNA mismatch endonuclease (patch repair protein)
MTDIVDKTTRSRMMAGIGGKNTKPELLVRKGLHKLGFRYLLHTPALPGKPDIVFPKYKAVILINGCFWHAHDCHLFKWPSTRKDFWREKILSNKKRDERNLNKYTELGWKVLIIWECAIKGKTRRPVSEVVNAAANWLQFDDHNSEIKGRIL